MVPTKCVFMYKYSNTKYLSSEQHSTEDQCYSDQCNGNTKTATNVQQNTARNSKSQQRNVVLAITSALSTPIVAEVFVSVINFRFAMYPL